MLTREADCALTLSPSEALSRFQFPDGDGPVQAEIESSSRARYGFRVGGIGILIGEGTASEVLEPTTVYLVPNTESWFKGLVNRRGDLVPLFDLRKLLGITERSTEKPMFLVLDRGEKALGLLIDGYPAALHALRNSLHAPLLPERLRHYSRGAFLAASDIWYDIDIPGLLASMSEEIGN